MVLLVAISLFQDWLGSEYNGVWLDKLGNAFVIDAPYSVWGTFDGKHYCAYDVRQVDKSEFYGPFQSNSTMVVGWTKSPAVDSQEAAQRSLIQDYPYDPGQDPPAEIPYIPASQDAADSGHLRIDLGADRTTLNFTWQSSDNKIVYAESAALVGKGSIISMSGTYKAGDLVFSISEIGVTSRRTFDGFVTIGNKQYALHGTRAWSRAAFTLSTPANPAIVARGWFEWAPTAAFTRKLLKRQFGPTDQIEAYIDLVDGEYPDGIHKLLTRE